MPEKKFVKAVCDTRNRHFGLDVEKFGSEYEVTNFVDITAEEATLLPTQVRQDRFRVHGNLQACQGDNSRIVGSSSYPYGRGNCNNGKYNYQCLFCNKLRIDNSGSKITGQFKKGDVIHLSQGQEIPIEFEDGSSLKDILIGAGWSEERGGHMDVDCSVILCGRGVSPEVVCYWNLEHSSGSIIHHGDNLTGADEDTEGQDDENIDIHLDDIPQKFDRLVFVFNIFSGQMLDKLYNMYFRVADPDSGKTLVDYKLHQGSYRDSAVVVAQVSRSGDGWRLKAVEQNAGCRGIEDLCDYVSGKIF